MFLILFLKKADLVFHTIAKIEAGSTPNPTIDTVKKIVDALDVSLVRPPLEG
jgi:predicted transcriptional regulator